MQYPTYDALVGQPPAVPPETLRPSYDPDSLSDAPLSRILARARARERERLETDLAQVERRLEERTAIADDAIAALEQTLHDERSRLARLDRPFPDQDRLTTQRQRIHDLEHQLHETQRAHWRDRQDLEAERRALRRELDALTDDVLSALF